MADVRFLLDGASADDGYFLPDFGFFATATLARLTVKLFCSLAVPKTKRTDHKRTRSNQYIELRMNDTPRNTPTRPLGSIHDFDFLAGQWKVSHRRLKQRWVGSDDWDLFEGEATCWSTLGGMGSIEELRVPARGFSGMGIRLFDVEKQQWSDYWVSSRNGVLTPPSVGRFENGAGTFISEDLDGDIPIISRGVWDRITPTSARWHQAFSRDGGKTWEHNWFMDWQRV